MFKIVEYQCEGMGCPKHFQVIEKMVDLREEDTQECTICHRILTKILSATKGYVQGTNNPCKC